MSRCSSHSPRQASGFRATALDCGEFGLRVPMRRHDVSAWKFDAKREQTLLARITVEHCHLGARGIRRRRGYSSDLLLRDDHANILGRCPNRYRKQHQKRRGYE
jgi:hypothetical protein